MALWFTTLSPEDSSKNHGAEYFALLTLSKMLQSGKEERWPWTRGMKCQHSQNYSALSWQLWEKDQAGDSSTAPYLHGLLSKITTVENGWKLTRLTSSWCLCTIQSQAHGKSFSLKDSGKAITFTSLSRLSTASMLHVTGTQIWQSMLQLLRTATTSSLSSSRRPAASQYSTQQLADTSLPATTVESDVTSWRVKKPLCGGQEPMLEFWRSQHYSF